MSYQDKFKVLQGLEEEKYQMEVFRFVLQHLPGKIKTKEIEEMIKTVDKNRDGKISYSEFRVSESLFFTL